MLVSVPLAERSRYDEILIGIHIFITTIKSLK